MILSKDLFEAVLTRYIERGADEVRIVSGYASPEMCTRLMLAAKKMKKRLRIRLIVGMTGYEGITVDTHKGLLSVQSQPPEDSGSVSVSYVTSGISVHSKLIIWMKGTEPLSAWMGSSNFTQNGFGVGFRGGKHKEIMTMTNVEPALAYFSAIERQSIAVDHPDVENKITIHNRPPSTAKSVATSEGDVQPDYMDAESVVLPLVALQSNPRTGTVRGKVHARSGLNWGQRPEYQRELNQAYIPVPASVRRSGFFPPLGVVFRVTTTDNKLFLMKLAQEEGKALETPQNNSFIGEYFRGRLGVANGEPVIVEDLNKFGSRFVALYRIDDGEDEPTYVMDYAPEHEERGTETYKI